MTKRTVLVADDDASLRMLVTATLADDDLELLEARDGVQALTFARQHRPRLILLDVAMPGLTGVDVCRSLKGDPATAQIPVVMLTAHGQPADRERGLAAGADAYLTKPFSPLQLLRLVEQLIRAGTASLRETPPRIAASLEDKHDGPIAPTCSRDPVDERGRGLLRRLAGDYPEMDPHQGPAGL